MEDKSDSEKNDIDSNDTESKPANEDVPVTKPKEKSSYVARAESKPGAWAKEVLAALSTPGSRVSTSMFDDRSPKVLDIIGCHREVTICGHVDLIRRLPIRLPQHRQLLDQYLKEPGNYEGRYSEYYESAAKLLDYGGNYVAVRLYDDLTRPELGEFLLAKGWRMIGFATNRDSNKTFIVEKWCNIRDH